MAQKNDFFSSGIEEELLASILTRIDKDIETRLNEEEQLRERRPIELPTRSALPEMALLAQLLANLRARKTPLFVLGGPILSKIAWILNLPLRLFLRKQIMYNNDILNALDFIAKQLYSLGDYNTELLPIRKSIKELSARMDQIEKVSSSEEFGTQLKDIKEQLLKIKENLELIDKK